MKLFKFINVIFKAIFKGIFYLWKSGVFNYKPYGSHKSISMKQRDVNIGRYGQTGMWGGRYKK